VALHWHKGIFQIKQCTLLCLKSFIEESFKDAPGRVNITLYGTNHEVPFVALGYHYSQKTILLFIMTKDSGSLSVAQ
jgi:hypothetical protein